MKNDKNLEDEFEELIPHYFEFLDRITKLSFNRTLDICIYLLNKHIYDNYFPSVAYHIDIQENPSYHEEMQKLIKSQAWKEKYYPGQFVDLSRRGELVYGLILNFSLRYQLQGNFNNQGTDNKLEHLFRIYSQILDRLSFICVNKNILNMKSDYFESLMNEYQEDHNFLPNLDFDPDFKEILQHKALECIFNNATLENLYNYSNCQKFGYPPIQEPKELIPLNSNNELISGLLNPWYYNSGLNIVGIPDVLDDFFILFSNYYCKKRSEYADEIRNYLLCFKELFLIAQGRLYFKVSLPNLRKRLSKNIPIERVNKFLEKFCLFNKWEKFNHYVGDFNSNIFIEEYNHYLQYAMYNSLGIVRTGCFIIWRSFIKYLEGLHNDIGFKREMAKLLEIWCYKQIKYSDIRVKKLVLVNENRIPDQDQKRAYSELKKSLNTLSIETVEIKIKFPFEYNESYFKEFDLIIRLPPILIVIECKKTASPKSQEPESYKWIKTSKKIIKKTKRKIKLLNYLLENELIEHPFFKDLRALPFPIIVKTEGFFSINERTPRSFTELLQGLKKIQLKHNIEN